MANTVFKSWNLLELGLLPDRWDEAIQAAAVTRSIESVTDGSSVTSREAPDADPIRVRVVTGDVVAEELPWLRNLYLGPLRGFAAEFAGRDVYPAEELIAEVNVNMLSGHDARYERHVDSNPVTGLLFVNTVPAGSGGELVFEADFGDVRVRPEAGLFLAFDARELVHYVAPLTGGGIRLTVPMNYYLTATQQSRPQDLSGYLYGPTGGSADE